MWFKKYQDLFLVKLFSVNSLGVILRSVLAIISQKIIAIFLGPDGIALMGNLKNALALFGMASSAGVDQGVVKYQAKLENRRGLLQKLYSTSLAYSLLGSVIVFLILFFGATFWSNYLLKTSNYNYLFKILSFTLPFTAIYNLCFSIINGKSNYIKATVLSFSTYTLSSLLVIFLVSYYQLSGGVLAVILTPILHLLGLLIFAKEEVVLLLKARIKFCKIFKIKLGGFLVMSFTAVVLSNLVDIQLRNYLINKLTTEDAGYWTSMSSLSSYYLSFMAGVYSLYVLPRYAKIEKYSNYISELIHILKFILPVFIILFIGMYFFRITIIKLLYTEEFLPMQRLFKWQLIGDFVKIISVVMAYKLISKNKWKLFIATEVVSYLLLYVLGVYYIEKNGVEGIVFAHFLRYLLYLIIIHFSVKSVFNRSKK
ncbi:O-antigen translocase [Algibacter amylolyticus]|nr:O-antigen translocase [Algibacter amylolyticus]MBB5269604.1 PST family polysaccharide transporter [Algibacter amylolyticus]